MVVFSENKELGIRVNKSLTKTERAESEGSEETLPHSIRWELT